MSHDVSLILPKCEKCGRSDTLKPEGMDSSVNFTYNYGPALYEAAAFGISELNGVPANVALAAVRYVIMALKPCHEPLIRGEGTWGTMGTLLDALKRLETLLEANPDAKVEVS
jgi:hypothetical protein